MKIHEFGDGKILTLNGHSYPIINGFRLDYNEIYFQLFASGHATLLKEYLPADWEIARYKIKEGSIYTIWRKKYFKYGSFSDLRNSGQTVFIAPAENSAIILAQKWILGKKLGYNVDSRVISKAIEIGIGRAICTVNRIVGDDQPFYAVSVEFNSYSGANILRGLMEGIQ